MDGLNKGHEQERSGDDGWQERVAGITMLCRLHIPNVGQGHEDDGLSRHTKSIKLE